MQTRPASFNLSSRLFLVFVLLAVCILALGYFYYISQRDHIKREVHEDVLTIADLKANQIAEWRKERMMDAEFIASVPGITNAVDRWLRKPGDVRLRQQVLSWMTSLSKVYDIRHAFLLDPKGVLRLAVSRQQESVGDFAQRLALEALQSGRVILSDLHRHEEANHIHIDICVPIQAHRGARVQPLGVLVVRIDPRDFLYPLIQTWPTPSKTAETLLVRREGDDVLYLNDLRHRQETALTFRLPLGQESMPAAMAVRGKVGVVEGLDYRGVPVLAAIRPVPDTPWFLVSKVDTEEIYAPVRQAFWLVMIITMLMIAGAGAAIALFRRQEMVNFYRDANDQSDRLVRERTAELTDANRLLGSEIAEHKKTEAALSASEWRFRRLVETMNEGLAAQDEKGILTYVNDKLCEMVGYGRDEIIGHPSAEFFTAQGRQVYAEQMVRRRSGHEEPYEATLMRKDRREIHAVISPRALFGEDGKAKGSFALVMDVTERKRAEEALRKSEEQLRQLSYRILTAQDTERRRISRELHDQLGQDLTLVKLMLRSLEKVLPDDGGTARGESEKVLQFVDQVIENVRRLSRDLSPAILEDIGLTAALQRLTSTFAENSGLSVRSDIAHVDYLVSKDADIMLYRVLQEALTNVAKHAGARNVRVAVGADDRTILFSVEDDGNGFDVTQTQDRDLTTRGLGLAIMDERVRFLGGSLEVQSSPGKGTRVSFSMPLEGT